MAALAAFYAYESRVPAIAREKASGLKEHYAADAAATRYFTLHQTADVLHADVWRTLIASELAAAPESAREALDAVEQTALHFDLSPLEEEWLLQQLTMPPSQ